MANKQPAYRHPLLMPLYPPVFISDKGTTEIPIDSLTIEQIGEKAFGLSSLPKFWTLPFIVVSDVLSTLYNCCPEDDREQLLKLWATQIFEAARSAGIKDIDPIIVRSSGSSEGLEERGKFYSSEGTLKNLLQPLTDCLQKFSSDTALKKQKIPLVIQKYAIPISAKGHLSNERRCYKESRDWLGDFEEIKTGIGKPFQINLRNWRKKIIIGDRVEKPLECNLTAHVSEVLKIPAAWAYDRKLRLHFEWVWDGTTIYLVQADQERESIGEDPTTIHRSNRSLSPEFIPRCLRKIDKSRATRYNKVRNVFTYMKLKLPITQLYVLDDQSVIAALASGNVSADLERDLSELVKGSLVIRMDIATEDVKRRQLLPRTQEVRELESALSWLKEKSAEFKRNAVHDDVVFIFHNFVPAVSSAFAYAAPGQRKVQIEALWGLPEGLYYHAHDKYIVDTLTPRVTELHRGNIACFEVREKCNFKRFFVAPDKDGHWTTKILRPPFDWRGAIQKREWIREIALESRRIAEDEGKPLSVMWFIGVPSEFSPRPIFPWYHELHDPKITSRALTHRTKTPFDKSLIIMTNEDINALRREAAEARSSVRRIRIQPREEVLLRDKNTLRVIGELAQKINAIILLEGGVLSHAYYQLMETNAIVEVLHPFGDFEDKQEFYKLVRDKVPSNIEGGGEVVSKTCLSGEFLLRALREKLTEEAFEVLDAIDQDSILSELADLSEIVDGILSRLGVSRNKLHQRQDKKRGKAGGFKDGLVLLETRNPLPTRKGVGTGDTLFDNLSIADARESVAISPPEVIERSHTIDKWSDRREHPAATEVILRLTIPMIRDSWTANAPEIVIDSEFGNMLQAKLTGTRLGSKLQIELSIFQQKQLKLL